MKTGKFILSMWRGLKNVFFLKRKEASLFQKKSEAMLAKDAFQVVSVSLYSYSLTFNESKTAFIEGINDLRHY